MAPPCKVLPSVPARLTLEMRTCERGEGSLVLLGAHPSIPIEAAPDEETEFDCADCCDWSPRRGPDARYRIGAILYGSRFRTLWFITSTARRTASRACPNHCQSGSRRRNDARSS